MWGTPRVGQSSIKRNPNEYKLVNFIRNEIEWTRNYRSAYVSILNMPQKLEESKARQNSLRKQRMTW